MVWRSPRRRAQETCNTAGPLTPRCVTSIFSRNGTGLRPPASLAEGDFAYIRNEGDRTEELFNEHDDPGELHNLVEVAAMRYVLERFRQRLDLMKANRLQRVP